MKCKQGMQSLLTKPVLFLLGYQRTLVPARLKCMRAKRNQFITILLELQSALSLYNDSTQWTGLQSRALISCSLPFPYKPT